MKRSEVQLQLPLSLSLSAPIGSYANGQDLSLTAKFRSKLVPGGMTEWLEVDSSCSSQQGVRLKLHMKRARAHELACAYPIEKSGLIVLYSLW